MPKYRFDEIAINSTAKKKPVEEDKYTYIGLEHLDPGSLKVTRYGSDIPPKGEKLLMKKGDVLFGKRRAYQKKVAIAPFDGIFSAHGMVLRPNEAVIDKDFFPLFISSDYFLDAAIAISVGSLSPTINWKDLAKLEFEIPSLEEQKKRAQVLWSMNRTMEEYKVLLEKTDDLVKSQFIETFGNGVDNPNEWEEGLLGEVCDVRDGTHDTPKYYDEGFPLVTSKNVTDGYINFTDCNLISENDYKKISERSGVSVGDILMPMIGTVGKPVIVEDDREFAIKNVLLIKFREGTKVINKYILALLQSSYFDDMVLSNLKGGNQKFVSLKDMRGLHVLVPPIELQEKFDDFMRQSDKSKLIEEEMCLWHMQISKAIYKTNMQIIC